MSYHSAIGAVNVPEVPKRHRMRNLLSLVEVGRGHQGVRMPSNGMSRGRQPINIEQQGGSLIKKLKFQEKGGYAVTVCPRPPSPQVFRSPGERQGRIPKRSKRIDRENRYLQGAWPRVSDSRTEEGTPIIMFSALVSTFRQHYC